MRTFQWKRQLEQRFECDFDLLITSGCSFTNNSTYLDGPVSWPGYVKDRCEIPMCEDLSNTGAGNEYIANSILARIEDLDPKKRKTTLVIVGWSGLNRKEELVFLKNNNNIPIIDDVWYQRIHPSAQSVVDEPWHKAEIWRSWKNIIFTKNYLENKQIPHAFFSYCNLIDPPFLPRRDLTPEWPGNLRKNRLKSLQQIDWIIPHNQSLFEYCFEHDDFFEEDMFHPNINGLLNWTDEILLPNLEKSGFIRKISAVDQK